METENIPIESIDIKDTEIKTDDGFSEKKMSIKIEQSFVKGKKIGNVLFSNSKKKIITLYKRK